MIGSWFDNQKEYRNWRLDYQSAQKRCIGLRLAQPHWPIGLASLVEFLHVAAESWAEFGGEDCFSVGHDVVLDLLDRFCQLLDQPLT